MNENPNFDIAPNVPAPYNDVLEAARIPIVMDPRDISNATNILKSNATLPFLELFNEPDYSYGDSTPTTDPVTSAHDLSPLINIPRNGTQYISPALANANNPDWLPVFFDPKNCPNCMSKIDIVAMHLYEPNIDYVIGNITELHSTWPTKRIWITEFGPYDGGGSGCTFDQAGVVNYAATVIPKIAALGYVDKVFWNCGDAEAADVCNPSLTNEDGSANDILKAYAGACGFHGS